MNGRAVTLLGSAALVVAMSMVVATAPVTAATPSTATEGQSADHGQMTFNNHCRTCHSIKKGDNRQGPSLFGVFGAKAGSSPGYPYSAALAGSGITWDEKTLDEFIANPDSVVTNNKMKPYTGLTDPAVRKEILAFLKSNGAE